MVLVLLCLFLLGLLLEPYLNLPLLQLGSCESRRFDLVVQGLREQSANLGPLSPAVDHDTSSMDFAALLADSRKNSTLLAACCFFPGSMGLGFVPKGLLLLLLLLAGVVASVVHRHVLLLCELSTVRRHRQPT